MSLVQSVFLKISTAVFEDKVFNLAVKVTNVYYIVFHTFKRFLSKRNW